MLLLALETSTDLGTCALWHDGRVVERSCPPGRPHSETLLPLVRELMAEAGFAFAAVDAVAFGQGPGAFTGLRVACGVAQGLAVAVDRPVVPVGTLEALAWACPGEHILALMDARMNEVYAATFDRVGDAPELRGVITVSAPEAVALPAGSGWTAAGNALKAYGGLAQRVAAAGLAALPEAMPRAVAVADLAARRLARGGGVDPAEAAPLYIRDKVARTVAERLAEGGRA